MQCNVRRVPRSEPIILQSLERIHCCHLALHSESKAIVLCKEQRCVGCTKEQHTNVSANREDVQKVVQTQTRIKLRI